MSPLPRRSSIQISYRLFCALTKKETCQRIEYEKKLWRLSKKGGIDKGFQILTEMKQKQIEITHYALSSMLHCCINNKKQIEQYQKVWNMLVIDGRVQADVSCYCLLIKAASYRSDCHQIKKWISGTKNLFFSELDVRKWNGFISALSRCNDICAMFDEYEAMRAANLSPDSFTFSILTNAAIKS